MKGKFGLIYIEDGKVYPAYPKDKEGREMVDNLAKAGMFGDKIIVDREIIGEI